MRRTLRVAIPAVALTLVAGTSASADPGDTLKGGCGFNTNSQPTLTGGENVGVIYELSLSRHASGLPSTASVACWIEVNGVEAPFTRISASGFGVQEAEALISFTAGPTDTVVECQSVSFADDGVVTTDCVTTV